MSELYIFARFHAREGCEGTAEQTLRTVLGPSREEPGCLAIHAFRSTGTTGSSRSTHAGRMKRLSDHHATLPHTVQFVERLEKLIDHPLDVTRSELID
jgi:quinol monooxygenase YgiN